jgi:hypothetical protein
MLEHLPRNSFGRIAGDENLIVKFFTEPELDVDKTRETGIQTYRDTAFISIDIPGNKTLSICTHANELHKERFMREWQAFEQGNSQNLEGYPIKMWAQVSTGQVKTLAGINVFSVEQLAQLQDSFAIRYQLQTLKQKAILFLDAQKAEASIARHQEELAARDAEIAEIRKQLEFVMLNTSIKAPEQVAPVEEVKVDKRSKAYKESQV